MKNLPNHDPKQSGNLMLYCKGPNDKKFNAIGSLKKMTYAPNLMYAVLIPESHKDQLIKFVDHLQTIDNSVRVQIRLAGTNKVIYSA